MTRDRWNTGWVDLPGTARYPNTYAHRPHPDRPAAFVMCGRKLAGRTPAPEPASKQCRRCNRAVERARIMAQHLTQRAADAALRRADGSVFTASAGLPGLGKR